MVETTLSLATKSCTSDKYCQVQYNKKNIVWTYNIIRNSVKFTYNIIRNSYDTWYNIEILLLFQPRIYCYIVFNYVFPRNPTNCNNVMNLITSFDFERCCNFLIFPTIPSSPSKSFFPTHFSHKAPNSNL